MEPRPSHRHARSTRRGARAGRTWIYAAILGLALVVLAVLQYHWTGEVSRLERERLGRATAAGLQRFAAAFDAEIVAIVLAFVDVAPNDLPAAWRRWQEGVRHPDLLAEVLLDDPGAGLLRLDPESGTLRPVPRPLDLPANEGGRRRRLDPPPFLPFSVSGRPPLVVLRAPPHGALLFLRLDLDVLRETVLPAIAGEAFGASDLEHDLWVVDGDDDSVVWTNRASLAAGAPTVAPRIGLAHLGALQELHQRTLHPSHEPPLDVARRPDTPRVAPNGSQRQSRFDAMPRFPRRRGPAAPWLLVAQHPAGSLDRAVARLRIRNLAVSSAVLALLGASGALLLLAARRAEDAARRQSEWVAGLTHELHTPLAALSAAGENLADGVITTPAKVREYGELIRLEGRRLQTLVAQALALARLDGLQRTAGSLTAEPTILRDVVDRAVAQRELERRLRDGIIAVDLPDDLPPVLADREALERAVGNLLDNALKHGGGKVWLLARCTAGKHGTSARVDLTVADDGPGLAGAERDAVFEPYVRGAAARENRVSGAGLGLHLVRRLIEEMGGTVTLLPADAPGLPEEARGAAFRISLPAAPAPAPEAA